MSKNRLPKHPAPPARPPAEAPGAWEDYARDVEAWRAATRTDREQRINNAGDGTLQATWEVIHAQLGAAVAEAERALGGEDAQERARLLARLLRMLLAQQERRAG